ncbi:MAG: hypothetical protein WBB39_04500 [Candidatus Saccharimonadales bacterium]
MKRQIILTVSLVISVFAFLGSLGVLGWVSYHSQPATNSAPIIYNAFFPDIIKDGSFRYYNGNTLLSYNLRTQSINPLLTDQTILLENISQLYWLDNGILFTVSAINPWTPLYRAYSDYINQPEYEGTGFEQAFQEIVWYMSFPDGVVKPLVSPVDSSSFSTRTLVEPSGVVVMTPATVEHIDRSGKKTVLQSLLDDQRNNFITLLRLENNNLTYINRDGDNYSLQRQDLTTRQTTTLIPHLLTSPGAIIDFDAIMSGNNHLIFTDFMDVPGDSDNVRKSLVSVDITSKNRSILIPNFDGRIENNTIIHTGMSRIYLYRIKNGQLESPLAINDSVSNPVTASYSSTNNGYYLFDAGGRLTLVTKDVNQQSAAKIGYSGQLEKKFVSDTISLARNIESTHDNEYSVIFASGSVISRYQELRTEIRKIGYDPYEFTFIITPGRAVTY